MITHDATGLNPFAPAEHYGDSPPVDYEAGLNKLRLDLESAQLRLETGRKALEAFAHEESRAIELAGPESSAAVRLRVITMPQQELIVRDLEAQIAAQEKQLIDYEEKARAQGKRRADQEALAQVAELVRTPEDRAMLRSMLERERRESAGRTASSRKPALVTQDDRAPSRRPVLAEVPDDDKPLLGREDKG